MRTITTLSITIIHAMLCTFAKNLYLICCDVPFCLCVPESSKEHMVQSKGNTQIINGDQYSITPPWITGWNGCPIQIAADSNQIKQPRMYPLKPPHLFVSSCCSRKCVSVCSVRRILAHLLAYQMTFTQKHSFALSQFVNFVTSSTWCQIKQQMHFFLNDYGKQCINTVDIN